MAGFGVATWFLQKDRAASAHPSLKERSVGCCFSDLNPRAELALDWHLEVTATKLAEVRRGRIRRLIINRRGGTLSADAVDHVQ
jgi:hypothetical protein